MWYRAGLLVVIRAVMQEMSDRKTKHRVHFDEDQEDEEVLSRCVNGGNACIQEAFRVLWWLN